MGKLITIVCFSLLTSALLAQDIPSNLPGQVSFISTENVYVKFKSTSGIQQGDTLYLSNNGDLRAALIVSNLSSSSCVCKPVQGVEAAIGDFIVARVSASASAPAGGLTPPVKNKAEGSVATKKDSVRIAKDPLLTQKIRGSLSAYSYSDFSNNQPNSYRFRYTLSMDAKNIGNSKFSAEAYVSFRHKAGDWAAVKGDIFNALKIYNLSLKYDIDKTSWVKFGRSINPKISSIGAMDGLQFEKSLKGFAFGAIAGSRPDFSNYSFDPKLFQYGGYVGYNSKAGAAFSETSLAFMQQTNHSKTDRRFLYFQHSNSFVKDMYFFGTFEVDLFKLQDSKPVSTFDPTGLYLSLRYKMTKKVTVSGSYDARKNVMYYETYKTLIDTLLENELRQGFRLQANYRITRDIMFGLQGGYRFLKTDPHPSKNAYTYLTYSQIPGINISTTLSATYLETSYLNGKILGIAVTRDLLEGKLQLGGGYRYIDYHLPENLMNITQHIAEGNISWQFYKKMSFSVNYEGTFEAANKYNRIYLQVRKRF